jgi:hypothetical protein
MPSLRKSRGLQGARLRRRSGSASAPGPFTGDVVVTVLDGGALPVEGASTLICPEAIPGPDTDASGIVRLSLGPGDYVIGASKDIGGGLGNGSTNVTVVANTTTPINVTLDQPFGALGCA